MSAWGVMSIAEAAKVTTVPAGTIRRWLSEGRICRFGESKPYRVSTVEVCDLRDALRRTCISRPGEQS